MVKRWCSVADIPVLPREQAIGGESKRSGDVRSTRIVIQCKRTTMDLVALLRAVANTRVKVAFLVGVAVVAYLPHAFTAATTHIGLPSATTLLASSFWPALAAFLLCVVYHFLPRGIVWAVHALGPSSRRWAAGVIAICVLAVTLVGALVWRDERVVRGAASLVFVAAVLAGGVALMFAAAGLSPRVDEGSSESKRQRVAEIETHARAATTTIVLSFTIVAVLLVWSAMARLPLGVGGLREPCVRVAVSAADLPAGVRNALLGDLAKNSAGAGPELTPPTRILKKDATEAFLWMGAGRGVTIPVSRISAIEDFDEASNGCSMSAEQIAAELGNSRPMN